MAGHEFHRNLAHARLSNHALSRDQAGDRSASPPVRLYLHHSPTTSPPLDSVEIFLFFLFRWLGHEL